jgi:hypothetical protein
VIFFSNTIYHVFSHYKTSIERGGWKEEGKREGRRREKRD